MVRDVVLCALVLVQFLSIGQCYRGIRSLLDDGTLELPTPPLSTPADKTNVLRSYLVRKNSFRTGPAKMHEAVKHSQRRRIRQRRENLLRNIAAGSLDSPVHYGHLEFDMILSVGTPPQQLIVEVDTGSDLNWVQCAPCQHCFKQPDALFNPKASTSYLELGCNDPMCEAMYKPTCNARNICAYSYWYMDESGTGGNLAYETFTIENSPVPHVAFGCGHNNSGTFYEEDGLMGLGRGPLTLPWQLSKATSSKTFSYCLVDQYINSAATASSPIIFGDAAEHSNATYTPLLTNPHDPIMYYVNVTGVSVGGLEVKIPFSAFQLHENGRGGVILDSGTTMTCWRRKAFKRIVKAFRNRIAYPEVSGKAFNDMDLCYNVSGSSLPFPGMTVHMTNVDLEIDSSHLFRSVNDDGDIMCLLMTWCDDLSIIGNIQQENYLVIHDVENMRIGFRAMQCDTLW